MSYKIPQIKVVTVQEKLSNVFKIDDPIKAFDFWHEHVATMPCFDPEKEHLIVAGLDTKLNIKGFNLVSVGSINETVAAPREIFRPVIAMACYGFIVMHNHPSGDCSPSNADIAMARTIKEGSEILKIHFLDNIIIGNNSHYSFRDYGLI